MVWSHTRGREWCVSSRARVHALAQAAGCFPAPHLTLGGRPGLPVWQFTLIYSSAGHVCRAKLVSDILTCPLDLKTHMHTHAGGIRFYSLNLFLRYFTTVIILPRILGVNVSSCNLWKVSICSAALSKLHLQTSSLHTLMFF